MKNPNLSDQNTPRIVLSDPAYLYKGAHGCYSVSLESELLNDRAILIEGEICQKTAMEIFLKFRYLAKSDAPINIYICSGGGEVTAGKAIYDFMQGIPNVINTFCIGRAASLAAILLAAGTKGHRFILPHSEVMIHEVLISGGIGGSATSISRISSSINETRDLMNGILARHTGKTMQEISEATSFDNYMDAQQAVDFGICDEIIDNVF